jgi:RNA methyltransferase, TrmH family
MKNKIRNELAVCGFATVKKLEKNHFEKISRLYFTAEVAPLFGGLCKKLAKNKGIYNQVEAKDLEKLCGSVHHQGVVAMINAPEIQQIDTEIIEDWIANNKNAVLLDKIGNANNFGAIVRSAAFFGIENIIIPLDESQSSITTSSYRVAEGGMEYVNIYSVRSISRLLEALKDKMTRVATSLNATKNVSDIKSMNSDKPILVILGNEENGVSETTLQNCDEKIIIPFKSTNSNQTESNVDSLNVAQAASIIFYELTK